MICHVPCPCPVSRKRFLAEDARGEDRVWVDPVEDKTLYLRPTAEVLRDVANRLHPKIKAI